MPDQTCQKCGKTAELKLQYRGNYCKSCFVFVFEKRARKELRELNTKKIILLDDGSVETEVIYSILKDIKGITATKDLTNGMQATSADILAASFLEDVFIGKKPQQKDLLLNSVTQEEIILYAAIKGIKGKKQHHPLLESIKTLEQKYPGSTFSTVKSVKELQGL